MDVSREALNKPNQVSIFVAPDGVGVGAIHELPFYEALFQCTEWEQLTILRTKPLRQERSGSLLHKYN